MIDRVIAASFIDAVEQFSSYKIRMYDEVGRLICGNDPNAHQSSRRALSSVESNGVIEGVSADGSETVIYAPVLVDGKPEGCISLIGRGSDIHAVSAALRMSLETRVKYESVEKAKRKALGRNEKLVRQLMCEPSASAAERAEALEVAGFSSRIQREPVVLFPDSGSFIESFPTLSLQFDSRQDVVAAFDGRVVVLKDVSRARGDLRAYLTEYEAFVADNSPFSGWAASVGRPTNLTSYVRAYGWLEWMKTHLAESSGSDGPPLFFVDYLDEYFLSLIPENAYGDVFSDVLDRSGVDWDEFVMVTTALILNNFNLVKASKDLFVHKNTLVYRLEKYKKKFRIDPVNNGRDRDFVRYLNYYIRQVGPSERNANERD